MLPKKQRIPRELFADFKGGRLFHSVHFLLRKTASVKGEVRLGVSVSKKVSKKAVVRNRVRRRAYAAAVSMLPSVNAGLYLLSAKSGAENVKGEALKAELAELLKKS